MEALSRRLRHVLLISLVIAVAGLAGCYATPNLSTAQWTSIAVMMSATAVAFGSVVAMPAARAVRLGGGWPARLALMLSLTMTQVLVGLSITHAMQLSHYRAWDSVARFAAPVVVIATLVSFVSLAATARLPQRRRWLRLVAEAAVFAFAMLLLVMVALDTGNRLLVKLLGALLLLSVTSMIAVAVTRESH